MEPSLCQQLIFGLVWTGQVLAHRFWVAIGKRKD